MRMPLGGQILIGTLDITLRGVLGYAQQMVEVLIAALCIDWALLFRAVLVDSGWLGLVSGVARV